MEVGEFLNKPITQWASIKAHPTAVEPWLELLEIYVKYDMRFAATYVASRVCLIDPKFETDIDRLGLLNWRSDKARKEILEQVMDVNYELLCEQLHSWLRDNPNDWFCWLHLAGLYELRGIDSDSKASALNSARSLEYLNGESEHLIGRWCLSAGKAELAAGHFKSLVDIKPLRHGSMMYLGISLIKIGQVAAAESAFERASHSNNPQFLSLLASTVYGLNYWREAIAVLKRALTVDSENILIWIELAQMQINAYLLNDAKSSLQEVFARDAGNATAKSLLAATEGRMGDGALALQQLESVCELECEGLGSRIVSSVAMTMLYQDDIAAQEIANRHRSLCAKVEKNITVSTLLKVNPERRHRHLRVGYVTGDLHRQHPVNIFLLPLLMEQKKSKLEVYVYHTGVMHDQYTGRAKECANKWIDAAEFDDDLLHKIIVKDEIDVLIDLAGHTSTHRLGVFAMRSAPIQASFLGYPHSTGLSQMDYFIGDHVVSPSEHQSLFSERLLNLPNSVFCWSPVDDYLLPPARHRDLPVVFGSFNNIMKLTPRTIRLWSEVLNAVPGSLLLLKAPSLADATVSERLRALFGDHGIVRERIECRGPDELSAMMQEYGDMDIALDPTAYNGGTTSMQALWMGVPLVTLEGNNFPSRMGASFLKSLGRPQWVAKDEGQFVEIAVQMAKEVQDIRNNRPINRNNMANSPLCDIKKYARDFEKLLHGARAQHLDGH